MCFHLKRFNISSLSVEHILNFCWCCRCCWPRRRYYTLHNAHGRPHGMLDVYAYARQMWKRTISCIECQAANVGNFLLIWLCVCAQCIVVVAITKCEQTTAFAANAKWLRILFLKKCCGFNCHFGATLALCFAVPIDFPSTLGDEIAHVSN